jgi:hypothetical protein
MRRWGLTARRGRANSGDRAAIPSHDVELTRLSDNVRKVECWFSQHTMHILRLSAMVALGFALLSGNALAQQQQTVLPPPSTGLSPGLPPLQSQITPPLPPVGTGVVAPIAQPTPRATTGFTTCTINCDTQAMNCQSACVPVTGSAAASLTAPAGATSSCNLSCTNQQLVCKQSCGPGQ